MSELKTTPNDADARDFIEKVEDETKKQDSLRLLDMFSEITAEKPVMWGDSIIGFGKYHYKSERSSQEGDWMLTAFSPRKQYLALYIMPGLERYTDLLEKLGPHKTGKSCLYVKRLADVDQAVLRELIDRGFKDMKRMNG
ncbi:MAG TPA: DUF1801 domain-containing protein [Candidatus Saccharimonadaceae bacterium]|nr:DUF1801 domain-containing protein [Candidatus Saccharimonadaceae bacterium]